jgi:PAS domain S-box-containing protein
MSDNRIMIVEDEEIVAADIQMSVEKMGYTVCATASSGREAIQKAESTQPDLVLMDIGLKESMDGIEAATRIKDLYQIPVIYLTAFGENAMLQKAKTAEPYGYITKPFNDRELHIAIEISIYKKEAENKIRKMERWFATVLKSIGDAVITSDKKRQVTFMNAVAEKLTGWRQEDALGKKLTAILNIKDQDLGDLEKHLVEKVIIEGLVINLIEDRMLIGKNGVEVPISDSAAPIKEENGDTPGSVLIFRDITASKMAEQALQESECKLQVILESLNQAQRIALLGSWQLNLETNHLWWSDETYRIFGVTPNDFSPTWEAIKAIIHPDDLTLHIKAFEHSLQTGESLDVNIRLLTKDGFLKYCHEKGEVFRDDSGQPLRFVGTIMDVTKSKQDEEQRIKLQDQLLQAQKMEAIGQLAGGVAHDFNNILGAILGYAEMAQEDSPAGSMLRKDIDQVVKASHRAKNLVKQILAFSRQAKTVLIPMQPAIIVREAVKMLRSSLPSTIDIRQNIDVNAGLILADPTQIHQIVMNLGTNAFHAMEETCGTLSISLQKKTLTDEDVVCEPGMHPGDFVELSVGDTGPGIAPELWDKIFDPYFTTKEIGKGTGMGLSIIHGIANGYGGCVSFHSHPGEGTVFQVLLPVMPAESVVEDRPEEIVQLGNERILFIDDEEILAEMGKSILERLGYHVTVRSSSLEALTTFQNQPDMFDLVITDQTMPGMTGSDLARRILQIRPGMPIILCTGYSSLISEEKAKSAGIKGFAMKPLERKSIAGLIRKVLDGGRLLLLKPSQ